MHDVEVELAPQVSMLDADRARKAAEISSHIKSHVGVTCKIAVKSSARCRGRKARPCESRTCASR